MDSINGNLKTSKYFFYFAIVHILLILIVSLTSTVDSYEQSTSYSENSFTKSLIKFNDNILSLNSLPIIKQYETIGGINAGYGFFAPNVASAYILKISVYDKEYRKEYKSSFFPPFKTREGLNRYHTLLGYFQNKLTIIENKLNNKKSDEFEESDEYGEYLDIFIKSIGRYYYKEYPSDRYRMQCTLYLYHYPLLQESILQKKAPVLIQLLKINVEPLKK